MPAKYHLPALVLVMVLAPMALAGEETRPRIMHAEMVTRGDVGPAHAVKVADVAEAPGAKPRMFAVPQIDKSKAEDPFNKDAPPPAAATAPAVKAAPAPAAKPAPVPAARPVLKLPELSTAQEMTRQQREMMLATSGPRKAGTGPKAEAPERPAAPDYSHVRWGYGGLGAPENWGRLSGGATCGTGKRQSPIDIRGGIRVDLEPIRFDYRPSQFRITDSGHTVEVDVAEGNHITVLGRAWQLTQIQFHRPSEERVNGKTFEMSVHLVHRDFANNIAVVAVLIDRGPEHPSIQTLWNHLPLDTGLSVEPPNATVDLAKLLPERREYYTYMGSLTTPPCTENVLWMVFKDPIMVSPEQIGIFARLYPNNARPIQPMHDRLIKESR